MRFVTVKAPEGQGTSVARLALDAGAAQVALHQVLLHKLNEAPSVQDVVDVETATPIAKRFVETLLTAPFYDPSTYAISSWHPRTVITHERPEQETRPIVVPSADVFEELWQFSHVTFSFIGRVLVAAALLAYGMIEEHLPLMIAGLLFLPYHHQMLSMGFGVQTREWRLLRQGTLALLASTALIVLAGACVAVLSEPPLRFDQFGSLLSGFVIALVVGIAAALASADDAGRRELIGLAATAHITILPAWFGISLVFGFPEAATVGERLLSFGISVGTLIIAASATYALLGMRGEGLRRFAKRTAGSE